jgi:CDP-diacylglycerol--glycerol-3-phosphate 3-phosphatidyltransferase
VNLPNSITMSRILMVPVFLWAMSPVFPWRAGNGTQEIVAALVFILAAITDGIDGYLARRHGQITTLGMLLDPLADKLMVASAFIALVAYNPAIVKVWVAVIVIGREFLINGLRSIATNEGFTIQASDLGKLKTVTQIVAVVAAILAHQWDAWYFGLIVIPVRLTAYTAVYFMIAVSVISATDYFIGFWKQVASASDLSRKQSAVLRRK